MEPPNGHPCPECGAPRQRDNTPACGCTDRAAEALRDARTAQAAAAEDFDPLRIRPYVEIAQGTPSAPGTSSVPGIPSVPGTPSTPEAQQDQRRPPGYDTPRSDHDGRATPPRPGLSHTDGARRSPEDARPPATPTDPPPSHTHTRRPTRSPEDARPTSAPTDPAEVTPPPAHADRDGTPGAGDVLHDTGTVHAARPDGSRPVADGAPGRDAAAVDRPALPHAEASTPR
ncbi:hypothetical protein, partial [Streptomyces cahuitamycinicus]|uniref:hypothetical protein n=1 Tax=Streptomyces cahuitamycinicus TaxID=2070367 RepID=UPI001FE4437D